MVFQSGQPPNINITSEDIMINTVFYIDLYINPYKRYTEPLARLEMTTMSTLEPNIYNNRIVGELKDTDLQFKQVYSKIGNFNPL